MKSLASTLVFLFAMTLIGLPSIALGQSLTTIDFPGALDTLALDINERGDIDHVGFTASFTSEERTALEPVILPLAGGRGFTGRAPGGPSRWSANRSTEWEPLRPKLVAEVSYDHFTNGRFRHGTQLIRWRPDKAPDQCH